MPSSKATGSFSSLVVWMTAIATGSNINTVAVLDIHILSVAAAAMKPKTSRFELLPPKARTMVRAMRKCAPLRSSAVASKKPPINNKTKG